MSYSVETFSESYVAILYQAQPPPVKDCIIKPINAGGGTDIAFALLQ
ncbi:hypothetical protein QNI19_30230 [Cytophagaceae bacterium DM2B3-1]|uniref:Uncharacterized protein n=1 Tax=Xanthocytophaga flava TaxID=3048013 RepID=A0ABT7CWD3_9BACT|nr:hypothetical protein [Xanthocytophaga flavus]MDJ1497255.1 hypothetical protein [Xanthocytophaga flavus]